MADLHPNIFKKLTRNLITIILLDGRKQTMIYDKTTKLSTLFDETCALCNIDCDSLFGFAALMDDYYAFLNLDTKVCKINFKEISKKSQNNTLFQSNVTLSSSMDTAVDDNRRLSHDNKIMRDHNKLQQSTSSTKSAPIYNNHNTLTLEKTDTPVIYFRVKSYVLPHCLRDKVTKSLYFLQLLRNVLDYHLKCVDEIYLQLGALAIQAFYGDYHSILSASLNDDHNSQISSNTESSSGYSYSPTLARFSNISTPTCNFTVDEIRMGKYFQPIKFFPSWIIDKYTTAYLFKEIPQLHKGLSGMSRLESEFSYIRMASTQYSNFNMHLFPIRDQKLSGSNYTLGTMVPLLGNDKRNGAKMVKIRSWLGLSPAGLEMHQVRQGEYIEQMSTLKWSDIDEVTHKSSRISIHVGCRILKLYTNTKMQADHLFWLTRHMHMYQAKARLNATCTAESLDNAERQKYREKYVYMDLDDLKEHGLQDTHIIITPAMTSFRCSFGIRSVARQSLVNTPTAPPRRTPSKAKPLKIKDIMKMANSSNEFTNASPSESVPVEKHPQYIKKSQPTVTPSNMYTPSVQKQIKSPDTPTKLVINLNQERESYQINDDSDMTSSINDSDKLVVKPPGRFVSLSKNCAADNNLFDESDDSFDNTSISIPPPPPPQQFQQSPTIVKSTSIDICDMIGQQTATNHSPQRHMSEPLINTDQLTRSKPLSMGLCHEFNNTQFTNTTESDTLFHDKSIVTTNHSTALKSWKSDVLFDLSNCLQLDNDYTNDNDNDNNNDNSFVSSYYDRSPALPSYDYTRGHSLPRRPGSYRDLVSLSSSDDDDDNEHDSVDISSISSFEMNEIKYSLLNMGHSTQVSTII